MFNCQIGSKYCVFKLSNKHCNLHQNPHLNNYIFTKTMAFDRIVSLFEILIQIDLCALSSLRRQGSIDIVEGGFPLTRE